MQEIIGLIALTNCHRLDSEFRIQKSEFRIVTDWILILDAYYMYPD
jgi:hypothetical protein